MKSKNKPKREKKKAKKTKSVQTQPKINTVTGYFNPWLYKYFKMD